MDRLTDKDKAKRRALARVARNMPKNEKFALGSAAIDIQNGVFRNSYQTEKWTYQDAIEVIYGISRLL